MNKMTEGDEIRLCKTNETLRARLQELEEVRGGRYAIIGGERRKPNCHAGRRRATTTKPRSCGNPRERSRGQSTVGRNDWMNYGYEPTKRITNSRRT